MKFGNFARWSDPRLESHARRVQSCARKDRHASQGAAEAHLRALARRFGDVPAQLHPYHCPTCRGWHLGRHGGPR